MIRIRYRDVPGTGRIPAVAGATRRTCIGSVVSGLFAELPSNGRNAGYACLGPRFGPEGLREALTLGSGVSGERIGALIPGRGAG